MNKKIIYFKYFTLSFKKYQSLKEVSRFYHIVKKFMALKMLESIIKKSNPWHDFHPTHQKLSPLTRDSIHIAWRSHGDSERVTTHGVCWYDRDLRKENGLWSQESLLGDEMTVNLVFDYWATFFKGNSVLNWNLKDNQLGNNDQCLAYEEILIVKEARKILHVQHRL